MTLETTTLKWYRSWPKWWLTHAWPDHLHGRPCILDSEILPRLHMENWDYNTCPFPDEDICMLEWDVALDRLEREMFAEFAMDSPNAVAVAPYHLNDGRLLDRGFGCVYLPRWTTKQFQGSELFSDSTFFRWYEGLHMPVRVATHIHPQHLNS